MENASKALMMAGGVLIGIMVLSFMVFMLRKGGSMSAEYDSQISDNELAKFNSQFEFYDKDNNTFFDMITVSNLAYDVNKRNGWDENNCVKVQIVIGEGNQRGTYAILPDENLEKNYFYKIKTGGNEKIYMYDLIPEYGVKENSKYKYSFKCEGIGETERISYNQTTGKVKEIIFKADINN